MGGSAYQARGASTGQAPTTVFFGPLADKYSMLVSAYSFNTGSSHGTQTTQTLLTTNSINNWVPWDDNWAASGGSHVTASVGATTTAPDGTSTAYHIVEGTNTGYHVMMAGTDDNKLSGIAARRRFAVFAKAAERTRCWLSLGEYLGLTGQNNQYEANVRCVFDLAGGQIGVPVAANNTGPFPWNFVALGAGIIPYGNGWYLCYIDVSLATNAQSPFQSSGLLTATVGPDSGSGTGAISVSYAGNGTSGIYVWNTCVLPVRAFGINTVSYFSDFTSISEIDVNNTLAPGFKWYVAGATWPGITYFTWPTPITPGTLTVSGSVMTVPPGGNPNPNVTTAAYNPSASNHFVGFGARAPFMTEWKGYFDYGVNTNTNSDELAWWMLPIDYIIKASNNNQTGPDYQEIDTVDSGVSGGEYIPVGALLEDSPFTGGLSQLATDFQFSPHQGYPQWVPGFKYSSGVGVGWMGTLYLSLVNNNQGNQPDLSPADWSLLTPSAGQPPANLTNSWNPNAMHVWTYIRIPDRSMYAPFDDTGTMLYFFDGLYCLPIAGGALRGGLSYGSSVPPIGTFGSNSNSMSQTRDGYTFMFMLGSGRVRNIFADYVRVTQ